VGKKEKHCDVGQDEDELFRGDQWDFVAFDPDSRLVLGVIVGRRITENALRLLEDVKLRLGGRCPEQITTDEYSVYPEAILEVFGVSYVPPRTGKPGRPVGLRLLPPEELSYRTVHKTRRRGRVVKVESRTVFGPAQVGEKASTSYLERQNGTDRHRNARKGRKTYRFSKDWEVHEAMTNFTMYSYNFCWAVRTLRQREGAGRWQQRTPAMATGLANHVWSLEEWLTLPAVQRK
jgi:IS1 family transposase